MNFHQVYIALGSNLGDREVYLRSAIDAISTFAIIKAESPIYETDPVGYDDQGKFLNMVIHIETDLDSEDLLSELQIIEHDLDRVRTIKNGPRTIDLDILLYDNDVIEEGNLIVPHPRMHERAFVLEPMKDIASSIVHPILKKTVLELFQEL